MQWCKTERCRIIVRSIVVQVVDDVLHAALVPPARVRAFEIVLDVDPETARLIAAAGIHVQDVVGCDRGKGISPAFAERDARVERIAAAVRATDGIGTRERVLVVVAPFVDDHVVVVFIRVEIFLAEDEDVAFAAAEVREEARADAAVRERKRRAAAIAGVLRAPVQLERGKFRIRLGFENLLHRNVDGIEDCKGRGCARLRVTVAIPARCCTKVGGHAAGAAVERLALGAPHRLALRVVHDTEVPRWRTGLLHHRAHADGDVDVLGHFQ